MKGFLYNSVYYFNLFIIIYFYLMNFKYITFMLLSYQDIKYLFKRFLVGQEELIYEGENVPPVSILVPAYNEQSTIVDTVNSLTGLDYPEYEMIVVNDGSSDSTLQELITTFKLRRVDIAYQPKLDTEKVKGVYRSFDFPRLTVVDKENGGKGDALNCGINLASYPLFAAIDADSVLEKRSLLHLVKPYIEDNRTIAVGGIVRIANGSIIRQGIIEKIRLPGNLLVLHQIMEYLRAFLGERIGWNKINTMLIISGAFGLFKKEMAIKAGGYDTGTIGEDMELVLRMHKYALEAGREYRIAFSPVPACWTQAPTDLKGLKSQRMRWHQGLLQSLSKHINMLFNPRYRRIGMVALPLVWLFELISPVIELIGYGVIITGLVLGVVSPYMLLFLALAVLYGFFLSLMAIFLEVISFNKYPEPVNMLKLVLVSMIEGFWYRPLVNFYRIKGMWRYFKKTSEWGSIGRSAFYEES